MGDDHWRELPPGPDVPEEMYAVVEIPQGSRNKYEYAKELGTYMLDRVLPSPQHYPAEYGFIPQTLYDDGDPMDVIVLMKHATFTGCVIAARPVGLMKMTDTGEKDDKVLAVPLESPHHEEIADIDDVPPHTKTELAEFFRTYKRLNEEKEVDVHGWEGRDAALEAVEHSIKLFDERDP